MTCWVKHVNVPSGCVPAEMKSKLTASRAPCRIMVPSQCPASFPSEPGSSDEGAKFTASTKTKSEANRAADILNLAWRITSQVPENHMLTHQEPGKRGAFDRSMQHHLSKSAVKRWCCDETREAWAFSDRQARDLESMEGRTD